MHIKKYITRTVLSLILFTGLTSCGGEEATNSVSIQFISAEPNSITLQGTGGAGLSETSIVQFRVKDPEGITLEGQIVNFSLSTSVGGITFNPVSGISDVNGLVNTVIQSGSIPTPVRVIANIPGSNISTQSDQLAITSGIPDQNSTTLGANVLNPEGYNVIGTEVIVVMRLGDAFNNPVPAGTSVSFTTEGGSIDGNCTTDTSGVCSVTWRSQNPRPLGGDGNGVVTILATALGQESFTDNNANGIFDAGDSFDDIGEAYRDDNNNNVCDAGEFFEDINSNGLCDGPDGVFNGNACLSSYSLCGAQKNVHVNDSLRLVMSTSFGSISILPAGAINVAGGPATVRVTITDDNGNSMPGNSSINVTSTNGEVQNSSSLPTIIPDYLLGPYSFDVVLGTDGTSSNDGVLSISVTSPDGNLTPFQVSVVD